MNLEDCKLIKVSYTDGETFISPKDDFQKYYDEMANTPQCLGTCGERKISFYFSDRPAMDYSFDEAKTIPNLMEIMEIPTCLGMFKTPCTCDLPRSIVTIEAYL